MKHLLIFNSMSEFEAAKPSMDTPFVVLEKGTPKVIFSNLPQISEKDLTDGDYVDLGLPSGLKWASCNLGAEKPCDYGDYYMWGSTTPNTDTVCNWANTPFNNSSNAADSTYFDSVKNDVCPNNVLAAKYDAVAAATNGAARMPTEANWKELLANTEITWVTCVVALGHEGHTAVNGKLFTSKTDSTKKIFIPASGERYDSSFSGLGGATELWSSSLQPFNTNTARSLYFRSGLDNSTIYMKDRNRSIGHCVRGVQD